jgi:hypothetical protein
LTGAEKLRSTDGTGRAATSAKRNTCRSLPQTKTRVPSVAASSPSRRVGISSPFGPSNPIATGIGIGAFSGWPGVGGTRCDTVSSYCRAAGS